MLKKNQKNTCRKKEIVLAMKNYIVFESDLFFQVYLSIDTAVLHSEVIH